MIPINHRHDNVVPPNLPALEAFLARRAKRAELAQRVREGKLTPRELRALKERRYAMSFLPLGNNIHRNNNILLGAADPFAAQVLFLAHYDTTLNADTGQVGTPAGATLPSISNLQFQFGGASLLANTTTGRVTYSGTGLPLTGALTIEGWWRINTFALARFCYGTSLSAGGFFTTLNTAAGTGVPTWSTRGFAALTGGAFVLNAWTAFALSTVAGTGANNARAYLNGVQVAVATLASDPSSANGISATFVMGNTINFTDTAAGNIDEFRITKAARYTTASYTVSTSAFPYP